MSMLDLAIDLLFEVGQVGLEIGPVQFLRQVLLVPA